jgi:hypothetical protein
VSSNILDTNQDLSQDIQVALEAMHRLPSTTGFQIKNKQLVIRQSVTVLF